MRIRKTPDTATKASSMTPEVRAARDRIAEALAAWDAQGHPPHITCVATVSDRTAGVHRPILAADLRTVLAALDKAAPATLTIRDPRQKDTQ